MLSEGSASRRLAKYIGTRYVLRATAGVISVGLVSAALVLSPAAATEGDDPSNVVVIMTDDQTLEQLRVMTATQAYFEQNGATFDNFITSLAVCCPSRVTFLTGQYALNHGVLDNGPPHGGYLAFDDTSTLPVWLQEVGYRTIFMGKYLNGYHTLDIPPGWSDWQGLMNNQYYGYAVNDNGTKVPCGSDPADYQTDVLADQAVAAIDESSAMSSPFFLWVSAHAPNNEAGALPPPAPRHAGVFAAEPLPQGPGFNEADVTDKPAYIEGKALLSDAVVDEVTAFYRAELDTLLAVDEMVDRIVTRLTDLEIIDSTVLFFTSDNGKMHGEHRLSDRKRVPYEESNHVPLLVAGPGFPAGAHITEQTANVDLAPTIAGLAGAVSGLATDGVDLRELVNAPADYQDRAVLLERYEQDCFEGVRTPTHTYVRYTTGEEELYDLGADPAQVQSLHNDPAGAAMKADLSARLDALVADGIEPCETPAPVLRVGNAAVTESRQGTVSVSVPLSLNVENDTVTASYTLQPQTAGSADFVVKSGSVKLKKGRLVSSIPVTVTGDSVAESDEMFEVVVTSVTPSIGVERAVGTVTIRNAPSAALPALNAGDVAVVEGDEPVTSTIDLVYATVSLSKRLTTPLVVDYTTADGTALTASDYEAVTGSVTIPTKSNSVKIPVVVLNDDSDEDDQTFTLNISTTSGSVTIGQSVATVTILDDDSE